MQRADGVHGSMPFYIRDSNTCGFGCSQEALGSVSCGCSGTTRFGAVRSYMQTFDCAGIWQLQPSGFSTVKCILCPVTQISSDDACIVVP